MQAFKVKLRSNKINAGRISYFLDIYPPMPDPKDPSKTTRRSFLNIHVKEKPRTHVEKVEKENGQRTAEQLRLNLQNELNKQFLYTEIEKKELQNAHDRQDSFLEFFKGRIQVSSAGGRQGMESALNYVVAFLDLIGKNDIQFKEVTIDFLEDLKSFIEETESLRSAGKPLAKNTRSSYFNKIRSVIKKATKRGLIKPIVLDEVPAIASEEVIREFLTKEEFLKLINTQCENEQLKAACILSGLTGIRYIDIESLTWVQVQRRDDIGYCIVFRQKKTDGVEFLPIVDMAFSLLGDRKSDNELVFEGLRYHHTRSVTFKKWLSDAGIERHFTFHGFRHTCAVMHIQEGTDIYTLSQLLGHRSLKDTLVYAKVLSPKKREAVSRLETALKALAI
ncbi:site-specific integrase [bacterium]|nr:site-specific integrase [bacterium]